jgi:CRP-like cAMP-binding protein
MMLEKRTNFQFVSSVYLFQDWSHQAIFGMLSHVKVQNYGLGDIVYKRGQQDNNIYMVYKGEVQIYVDSLNRNNEKDVDDPKSYRRAPEPQSSEFKSLLKLCEGSYFGDEEGFIDTTKIYFAKVTSVEAMFFVVGKDKIRLNAQQSSDPMAFKEVIQKSQEKADRLVESKARLSKLLSDQKRQIDILQQKKSIQSERNRQNLTGEDREIEACNQALTFSNRVRQSSEQIMTNNIALHSKLADRVEQLVMFKENLIKTRHLEEGHDGSLDKKFIDFSIARSGKNIPGKLTFAKQMEIKNRMLDRSLKIEECKMEGLKYRFKDQVPDKAKISHKKLSSYIVQALRTSQIERKKPKIYLTEGYSRNRKKKPWHSVDSAFEDNLSTSMKCRVMKVPLSLTISTSRHMSVCENHSDARVIPRSSAVYKNRLLRTDRASRATARKINLKKQLNLTMEHINSANTKVQAVPGSTTDTFWQPQPVSSLMPSTARTATGSTLHPGLGKLFAKASSRHTEAQVSTLR